MSEPTVEEVLALNPEKAVSKPSAVWPIVLFFIFPPLGIVLLWKEKSFHWVYAVLATILGLSAGVSFGALYFFVFPKLSQTYIDLKVSQPGYLVPLVILVIFLALVQTCFGVFLAQRGKSQGYLDKNVLILLTVLVVFTYLILPVMVSFLVVGMIWPLYNVTSSF